MKRKALDTKILRKLIIAMIMNRDFLASARPHLDDASLISEPHFREIVGWCVDYFDRYNKAPGREIEGLYYEWANTEDDKSPNVEAVHGFISSLSSEYDVDEEINVGYLLESLGKYLSKKKLEALQSTLEDYLYNDNIEGASKEVTNFRLPRIGAKAGIDVLNDGEAWKRAFKESTQPLIQFSGDAGNFFNPAFTRESLVGIQGPEKRGKTWWCIEFALRALKQRRKVAFFEVGDLSEQQILRRLAVRITGRPMRLQQCGLIDIPNRIAEITNDAVIVENRRKAKDCPIPISVSSCAEALQRFLRGCGLPKGRPYFKLSVHPTLSINVREIDGLLKTWEIEDGFIPDVIVIDYADILLPEKSKSQNREEINETWAALRRLSQERKCLVLAPTQADAASYDRRTQTMKNFSEDKRKLAHVTGMLGLNQDAREKNEGIMRLNWIVLREAPFAVTRCLYVGQCLTLGKVLCCSKLDRNGDV